MSWGELRSRCAGGELEFAWLSDRLELSAPAEREPMLGYALRHARLVWPVEFDPYLRDDYEAPWQDADLWQFGCQALWWALWTMATEEDIHFSLNICDALLARQAWLEGQIDEPALRQRWGRATEGFAAWADEVYDTPDRARSHHRAAEVRPFEASGLHSWAAAQQMCRALLVIGSPERAGDVVKTVIKMSARALGRPHRASRARRRQQAERALYAWLGRHLEQAMRRRVAGEPHR